MIATVPRLLVELTATGIRNVTIRTPSGTREAGLVLLNQTLPGLIELDRVVRGGSPAPGRSAEKHAGREDSPAAR